MEEVIRLTVCEGCGKEGAKLQCPKCLQLHLQASVFCAQSCFQQHWPQHKLKHLQQTNGGKQLMLMPMKMKMDFSFLLSTYLCSTSSYSYSPHHGPMADLCLYGKITASLSAQSSSCRSLVDRVARLRSGRCSSE